MYDKNKRRRKWVTSRTGDKTVDYYTVDSNNFFFMINRNNKRKWMQVLTFENNRIIAKETSTAALDPRIQNSNSTKIKQKWQIKY